jgi:tetratricopeptide (TPR) repeat protein
MKAIKNKLAIFVAAAIGLTGVYVFAIQAVSDRRLRPQPVAQAPDSPALNLSVADRKIREAEALIAQSPSDVKGYNLLCTAYLQKARETGDFSFNSRAEHALKRSFEVAPDNFDAIKLQATLMLTFHRFQEALEIARRADQIQPKDPFVYAALVDALVELGKYEEANKAADTLMALRPDVLSYTRVSYLRSLHGDTEGAIEVMRAAVASAREPETNAWCRVHLADDLMKVGKLDEAEREINMALRLLPEYHLALAAKARARIAAGDLNGAAEFYKRAQNRVPLPDTAIALGDLYTKLGLQAGAKQQYELVEFIEQAGAAGTDTYSRQLALYWANHDQRLDEALEIARRERAQRDDIYTCDTLAWCLFKKGELEQAESSIKQALRLGTRDPQILYHAGMIYERLAQREKAAKYLALALKIDPSFDLLQAEVARRTLSGLL